jgi:hypothetical protein
MLIDGGGTLTVPGVLSKHAELIAEVEAGFEGERVHVSQQSLTHDSIQGWLETENGV